LEIKIKFLKINFFFLKFLFVGGTFYAKNILLNKIVSERFKKDFQDNTKEKAPSLEVFFEKIFFLKLERTDNKLIFIKFRKKRNLEQN